MDRVEVLRNSSGQFQSTLATSSGPQSSNNNDSGNDPSSSSASKGLTAVQIRQQTSEVRDQVLHGLKKMAGVQAGHSRTSLNAMKGPMPQSRNFAYILVSKTPGKDALCDCSGNIQEMLYSKGCLSRIQEAAKDNGWAAGGSSDPSMYELMNAMISNQVVVHAMEVRLTVSGWSHASAVR